MSICYWLTILRYSSMLIDRTTSGLLTRRMFCVNRCLLLLYIITGNTFATDTDRRATKKELTCPGLFLCKDGSSCITKEWVCDGEADCLDQSDEIGCETPMMPVENNFTTDAPYLLKEHGIQQEDITREVMEEKRYTEPWPNKSNAATSTIMALFGQSNRVGSSCKSTADCGETLLCIRGKCRCIDEEFWKTDLCIPKKTLNDTCDNSFECNGKLLCFDGSCQCPGPKFFWNGTNCLFRKIYREKCRSTSECQEMYRCKDYMCDCLHSDYWTGSQCSIKKDQNERCTQSKECKSTLLCLRQLCQCPLSDYWTGSMCALQKGIGGMCIVNDECQPDFLCIDNACQCIDTHYFDGENCVVKKVSNVKCLRSNECQDTMQCVEETCQCDETRYWEIHSCVNRKDIDSSCLDSFQCKENLRCENQRCVCDDKAYWDGLRCTPYMPSECDRISESKTGIYTIYPKGTSRKMSVYCIMEGGEKWTVIQRRFDGSVDFYRTFSEYKAGFGYVDGEHWLGNENINLISNNGYHRLSIRLEDWDGNIRYANYSSFRIKDASQSYELVVSSYNGNAGDGLNSGNFYTKDHDHYGCAESRHGGWWYNSYRSSCGYSNLNGKYNGTETYKTIHWYHWQSSYRNLKSSMMMIRMQ